MSNIIPNLYLGNKSEATNNHNSYDCIISVIDYDYTLPHDNQYNIKIFDDVNQSIIPTIYKTADIIDKYIKDNKKVLVHCSAGVSRSATIVIAYLMIKHKMTYMKALIYVKMKRNIICPNQGFKRQLMGICSEMSEK